MEIEKREKFEVEVNKLRELYDKDPDIVAKETKKLVNKLNSIKKIKNKKLREELAEHSDILTILVMAFLVLVFGMIDGFISLPIYFFGMIFFFAGIGVALGREQKGIGIICLFSHGATGLGMMLVPKIWNALESPLLTDGDLTLVYIYCCLIALFLIAAFAITIIYNLSDRLKSVSTNKLIPLSLFLVVIILSDMFSKVIPLLIR